MKTIAVSETAYTRLASWKTGKEDTFSDVIERLIPPKGSLAGALAAAKTLPELSEGEFAALEDAVNATRIKLPTTWK